MSITQVTEQDSVFLSSFRRLEKELRAEAPPWVYPLRKSAMAHFAEIGFPTTRQEEWRFTDVSPLAEVAFEPAEPPRDPPSRQELEEAGCLPPGSPSIVFVDGHFCRDLSSIERAPNGVILTSLA